MRNKAVLPLLLTVLGTACSWSQPNLPKAPLPKFETERCRRAYSGFYEKEEIDVRVVFGYKDARPARFVADRYERAIFVERILTECRSNEGAACSFRRVRDDADLFLREIRGPDGEPRRIRLRVVQSSAGADDEENRRDPFQNWRTEYAEKSFFMGIEEADAVFYNGHSRQGGGPDFGPPRITASGKVAFSWYGKHEPGLGTTLRALQNAKESHLKLLGLFSCDSTQHFLLKAQSAAPSTGFITSGMLVYFSDALEGSLTALSALLSMKCEMPETKTLAAHVSGFL